MHKLGFMVTCYDEVNAIDVAMTSLRHHYPDAPVTLFCEKDDKTFSRICDKHNIAQGWSEDTQSDLLKLNVSNYSPEDYSKVEWAIKVFLKRVNLACLTSRAEYICLHCPDTLIRGQINIPEGAGLLGSCVNTYFFEKISSVVKKHGGIEIDYFGAVPAIFNVADFHRAHEIVRNNPSIISALAAASCYSFSHDILMAVLFALIGKREEYTDQITECDRNLHWMRTNCPIIHQFRTFYPKRTTKYNSQQDA